MMAPFECEVRFAIDDIEAFHRRLLAMDARVRRDYAFTDHYYRPAHAAWDPRERALRIRDHQAPPQDAEVLLTRVEIAQADGLPFKRSRFAEGKVRLYTGRLPECRRVVESLGFVPWIAVRKRDGRLVEIPEFGELVTEHVDGVGWMGEVEEEGTDTAAAVAAIRAKLARLGIDVGRVTGDPVAAIVARGRQSTPRRVYFSGAIRGGRDRQPLYRTIVDFLQDRGYQVLTTHVAAPDVLQQELRDSVTAHDIYARDLQWLADCDIVVAEVSTPSLGVGVEIAAGQHLGKPVIALVHQDVALSAMVAGNPAVRLITYAGEDDLFRRLSGVLGDVHGR